MQFQKTFTEGWESRASLSHSFTNIWVFMTRSWLHVRTIARIVCRGQNFPCHVPKIIFTIFFSVYFVPINLIFIEFCIDDEFNISSRSVAACALFIIIISITIIVLSLWILMDLNLYKDILLWHLFEYWNIVPFIHAYKITFLHVYMVQG